MTIQTGNIFIDITFPALEFFFQITKNYGLAIVLLTTAVRLAMYPLSVKQYESMHAMSKIQPKVKELQKKHGKDAQKFQQESMALYKEHNVNPLGGCLPLLLQFPIMIALFTTLRNEEVIKIMLESGASTFFWIKNLGMVDPAVILTIGKFPITPLGILIGISTYLTQKTMVVSDQSQAKMMAWMPILMVFFAGAFPAGVSIYWITSNLLMAAQQYSLSKQKLVKEQVGVIEVIPKK
jgi:YidC/Oxa1 family membrane protein insertase